MAQCKHCQAENPEFFPKERYDAVNEKARAAELTATTLAAKLTAAEAAVAGHAATTTQLTELQAEQGSWQQERALYGAGLTDAEGIGVARVLYAAMPEADRPPSIAEWVTSDSAPRAVRSYLPAPAAPPVAPIEGAAPAAVPPAAPRAPLPVPSTAPIVPRTTLSAQEIGQLSNAEYARLKEDGTIGALRASQ